VGLCQDRSTLLPGIDPPTRNCARQERDLRAFARKAGYNFVGVWKEMASGAKDERAERVLHFLAVLKSPKVDSADVCLSSGRPMSGRSLRPAKRGLAHPV
jgi:hypothetical protein